MPAHIGVSRIGARCSAGSEEVAHTLAYDGTVVGDSMSGNPMAAKRWGIITQPTLVLDGGQTAWTSTGADALAAALPRAQRRTLAGQEHGVAPAAIGPALAEFFNS
jgi:pimeloyl-ACP methyl ester carboxylesterase